MATEADYILFTNLAKVRMAEAILRDVLMPDPDLAGRQAKTLHCLQDIRQRFEEAVKNVLM